MEKVFFKERRLQYRTDLNHTIFCSRNRNPSARDRQNNSINKLQFFLKGKNFVQKAEDLIQTSSFR